ncbi:sugar phosphate isomerase/epimerase [Prosthecobacter fusiformis]|uniref:Sugar phosphate isomerase/epimerase n=1 Tax=Prosthecobacter fusiformis TaxID=48464 RepID=A0A4R7RI80_9BACT|nr:sugar phosphate isomerase/epimerase family protein [Prosthecobacter fusiformis]TDU62562.1 sugar phosphate isomerase/epimerase [Prosthecobacter fusiformis]
MNRRHFLQSLAAAAAAPVWAAPAPWKLNYMLASAMYGNLSLTEILPEVKKTGATGIELWPKKHGTQREEMDAIGHEKFAEMLAEQGLTFGGTTRYDLGPFGLTEEIAVLKKLGGKFIVTGGKGEYKVTPEQLKLNVKDFVEQMKPHAALAAENGVEIGIENHINNIIDTPDSLLWLADEIRDLPGIGIALAPYHLPQETALLADLIKHIDQKMTLFYAWGHGMGCMKPMPKDEELQQMPGRGDLDWKPLLQALKEVNFTGPTEIFMHPTPRGIPILPTAAETTAEIVRARKHLDSLL